jgi:VWFA-related protein
MLPRARLLAAIGFSLLGATLSAQEAAQPAPDSGAVLKLSVNSVLIPVVVRDAQGLAVGGLKADDFKVIDQGKARKIAGFTAEGSEASAAHGSNGAPAAGSNAESASQSLSSEQRIVVFLFDDRHLDAANLAPAKMAAMQMLDQPLPEGTRGLVLSFLGINSGITHDRAALQAAIAKIKTRKAFEHDPSQCPDIDYYAADQILNKDNRIEYGIAMEKAANCLHIAGASANGNMSVGEVSKSMPTVQAQLAVKNAAMLALQQGDLDARETLGFLGNVVHSLSKIPGRHTLILISPGFLSLGQEPMEMESQVLNLAAGAAVTINTLDARGLYGTMMSASESGDQSMRALVNGQEQSDREDSMRQDKQIMAELADGAGGRFFHNNNDLTGGLATLAAGPEYKYLLELPLSGVKQNGSYHALKVEVDRKGTTVQAREGYFAPLAAKGSKNQTKENEPRQPPAPPPIPPETPAAPLPSGPAATPPATAIPDAATAPSPESVRAAPAPNVPHIEAPADKNSYIELSISRLKDAVPSLKGIQYDSSQQQLPSILAGVAKTISDVLPRLPDLVSREDVLRSQGSWDSNAPGGLAAAQPSSREFKYLLQCRRSPSGATTISESRIDSKGRPVTGEGTYTALRGYGFAYQWLFFSAANQREFRFRYLGEQQKEGRNTFVIAFAQDPAKVADPAYFEAGGQSAPFYFQGVLWVDQTTFDIVRLRTDLLSPLPELHLRRLSTELTFRSAAIRDFGASFWLPSEVDISSNQGRGSSEESHRYSDYHLFHAEAKIVTGP